MNPLHVKMLLERGETVRMSAAESPAFFRDVARFAAYNLPPYEGHLTGPMGADGSEMVIEPLTRSRYPDQSSPELKEGEA
jgi:hypothetical protein